MELSSLTSVANHTRLSDTMPLFFHAGIEYKSDKCEITFSSEAMEALQALINRVQSDLSNEPPIPEVETHKIKKITTEIANIVADAMIISGKGEKAGRFLERAMALLKGKKIKPGKVEKMEEKLRKHSQDIYDHIFIEYTEGAEKKILNDTPIIVRPGEDIEKMIKSLRARLRFSRTKK